MNIIIVDESIKKAKVYARRIISDYLHNIGRDVWMGSITENGLESLKIRLKEQSSKNMSVACFVIKTRKTQKLLWIVGNSKNFDEDGNFAFKYKTKANSEELLLNDFSRELRNLFSFLSYFAGIFHDVGKNYYFFQNKLYYVSKGDHSLISDPVRHEKLSCDIFLTFCEFIKEQGFDISNEQKDIFYFFENLKRGLNELHTELKNMNYEVNDFSNFSSSLYVQKDYHSLITSLSHLILTHHKLPFCENYNVNIEASYENQKGLEKYKESLNKNKDNTYDLFKNQHSVLKFSLEKIDICLDNLLNIISKSKNKSEIEHLINDELSLLFIVHYIMRPSIIIADQFHSSQKIKDKKDIKYESFANLIDTTYNQTVETHLKGVADNSKFATRFLINCISGKKKLNETQPSKELIKYTPLKLKSRFGWQDDAIKAITDASFDKEQEFGFFGFVMGKTGSGKTRANAKIMSKINNNKDLRFSVVLGLKTLTLQTYDEYKTELNLKNVIGVIGDNETRNMHEINKNYEKGVYEESLEQEQSIEIEGEVENNTPLPNFMGFDGPRDSKLKSILKTPITVSTIDYFINAIDTQRSSKTRFLTRLMTSDLVIDEIDSFTERQSTSIAKLIFLSAMYGRKVLISSATTPNYLVEFYKKAYKQGYEIYAKLSGRGTDNIYIGGFTHFSELNKVDTYEKFNVDSFFKDFKENIENEKPKRQAFKVDLSESINEGSFEKAYSTILEKAIETHKNNYFTHKKIRISTGLIKFANTDNTVDFSNYLISLYNSLKEKGILLKLECYHAKNLKERKSYVERELSILLNRKNDHDNSKFLAKDRVAPVVEKAEKEGYQDVLILVISSPIIEIGRDFDFDWCIMEPRDHRGIVQTAGRVLRHREKFNKFNCGLLSHSMKCFIQNKNQCLYANPGAEMAKASDYNRKEELKLSQKNKEKDVFELFEYCEGNTKIDASVTIEQKNSPKPIKYIEDLTFDYLENKRESFQDFLSNKDSFLTFKSAQYNPFRDKEQREEEIQYDIDFDRFKLKESANKNIVEYKKITQNIPKECLLIPENLEYINNFYKDKNNYGNNIYNIQLERKDNVIKEFYFNEYLGFKYK